MAFRVSAFVFVMCALSALTPQQAYAVPDAVIVRYDDTDPHSAEGAHIVLRRIERAAREVCGADLARRYPSARREYRRCTMRTMWRAIDAIGVERLESAFIARYGHI